MGLVMGGVVVQRVGSLTDRECPHARTCPVWIVRARYRVPEAHRVTELVAGDRFGLVVRVEVRWITTRVVLQQLWVAVPVRIGATVDRGGRALAPSNGVVAGDAHLGND